MGPSPVGGEDKSYRHRIPHVSQEQRCGRIAVDPRAEYLGHVRVAPQAVAEALGPVIEATGALVLKVFQFLFLFYKQRLRVDDQVAVGVHQPE